jgi:exopolyphosphatase / guanosine-5'-triphosphate,3'-diphosphate pyrophosphatase
MARPRPSRRGCSVPGVVRCACIDIGSNTTRLLVADVSPAGLEKLEERRVFTHVRRGVGPDGRLAAAKIAELVEVAAAQLAVARAQGSQAVVAVATAAIRRAVNAEELAAALHEGCGLELRVLSEQEEARLAFVGAARALAEVSAGEAPVSLGVADVGGGSSELVVGAPPGEISWLVSLPLGSGDLAEAHLRADPPATHELDAARRHVREVISPLTVPRPARAVAVGGSAASLHRLAGAHLERAEFAAALELLRAQPAAAVAARFDLEVERVRLLPAGLLILEAAQAAFGVPLELVGGGLREGVVLELGD